MTTRRGARPTHVRPRPPSDGRPAAAPVRPRAPAPGRITVRTPVRRSRGVPLVGRLALGAAILGLGAGVLYLGAGGLTTVAGMVGSTLTGFVEDVTSTPTPIPTEAPVAQPPSIASPSEPYTNRETVDLIVTVDKGAADAAEDHRIRVYLALEDQEPAPIQESPVSAGPQTIIPVQLTDGINDFAVTLVGPDGESESSPIVRYVLDRKKPGISIVAPRDGATINRRAVDVEGRSQSRSTLIARNTTTGDSISGTADSDGRFTLSLPIGMGRNVIVLSSSDPAGNVNEKEFTVTRGSGKLRAAVGSSIYSIKRSALPSPITLYVTVDDPDGKPLEGARVTFTLSIPGVKTVTGDAVTDANGRATFETTIPKSADPGGGTAGVLVRTEDHGRTTDETVVTIRK